MSIPQSEAHVVVVVTVVVVVVTGFLFLFCFYRLMQGSKKRSFHRTHSSCSSRVTVKGSSARAIADPTSLVLQTDAHIWIISGRTIAIFQTGLR